MEKVSKINVFRGRERGTKSKNLIPTGSRGADTQNISALFLFSHAVGIKPYGVFMPTFCCLLKTVSKRVENPLFLPLCATNQKGHGCFPVRRTLEGYRRIKELGKQLKNLGMLVIQG